jgi:hypothetical protein
MRFCDVMSQTAVAAKAQMPPVAMLIDSNTAPSIASFCAQCSAGPVGLPSALSESATTNTHMRLPKTAPPATPYLPAGMRLVCQHHVGGRVPRRRKRATAREGTREGETIVHWLRELVEKVKLR